jgi:tetratricopeptide (TPR) repeat protein
MDGAGTAARDGRALDVRQTADDGPAALVARWVEVHRLAVAGRDPAIARAIEAVTLNNIGGVHKGMGDREQALAYYTQALLILREVGDRVDEAVTRYDIAMIHRADGNWDEAVRGLELVVDLDRQVGHPDLEPDPAMLEQVRRNGHSPATAADPTLRSPLRPAIPAQLPVGSSTKTGICRSVFFW